MPTIAHLIDDTAVGGVNRMLCDQSQALADAFTIETRVVNPRRPLPPSVGADVAVVHFTPSWSKLPFLTLLRGQRGDARIVLIEHTFTSCFEKRCVPSVARFRKMLRLAYRLADVVVAVSHGQARWMLEAGLLPAEKLVVIQPSVDLQPLAGLAPPRRKPGTPVRIAAYGRYAPQKGFDVLVAAMARLQPGTATLTLAGYGPDEAELRQMAQAQPNISIAGPVSDLASFLDSHDAVVVPSRWEAFGLVALEARAAARPVIVGAVDGLVEQIQPAHGAIVSPDDPASLARAIEALAGRDVAAMGIAARRSTAGHFDAHAGAWRNLLLKSARGAPAQVLAA